MYVIIFVVIEFSDKDRWFVPAVCCQFCQFSFFPECICVREFVKYKHITLYLILWDQMWKPAKAGLRKSWNILGEMFEIRRRGLGEQTQPCLWDRGKELCWVWMWGNKVYGWEDGMKFLLYEGGRSKQALQTSSTVEQWNSKGVDTCGSYFLILDRVRMCHR